MLHKNIIGRKSGFRELSCTEITAVSGGYFHKGIEDVASALFAEFHQGIDQAAFVQMLEGMAWQWETQAYATNDSGDGDYEVVFTLDQEYIETHGEDLYISISGLEIHLSSNDGSLLDVQHISDLTNTIVVNGSNIHLPSFDTLSSLGTNTFDADFVAVWGNLGVDSVTLQNTTHDCEASATGQVLSMISAATVFDGLNGTASPEYGGTIASSGGNFIASPLETGESYNDNNPPRTAVTPPIGYGWSEVVAIIHSHPPSGDVATDIRNQAPSDGDWLSADQAVARGADPSTLTLTIVDSNGVVRSYDYKSASERGATASNPSGDMDNAGAANTETSSGSC